MKLGPEVAGKAPEKKALSHTPHLGKVVRRRGTERRGGGGEGSQPAETQVASRSVGQKLEGDLCRREKGRGHGEGGGFDNELETNFISMQACCLSL